MDKMQLNQSAKMNASIFLDQVYEPALQKAQVVMEMKNREMDDEPEAKKDKF